MHYSSSIIDSGNTLGQEKSDFVMTVWQDEGGFGQLQMAVSLFSVRKVRVIP